MHIVNVNAHYKYLVFHDFVCFFSSQKYKEDICAKKQSNHDTKLFLISWNLLGVYKPYPTYPSL